MKKSISWQQKSPAVKAANNWPVYVPDINKWRHKKIVYIIWMNAISLTESQKASQYIWWSTGFGVWSL